MASLPKVELHIHLDGSIRLETAWELAQKKGNPPKDVSNLEEYIKKCVRTVPGTLKEFLDHFEYFMPYFVGDLDAIRRMAREFAEDRYQRNIVYCEARFCPQFLIGNGVTTEDVTVAVLEEFKAAEERYEGKIKIRTILCCIRPYPDFAEETLRLSIKYKDSGIVAIDMAGDEKIPLGDGKDVFLNIFKKARDAGVHITVHAGECGTWEDVKFAREQLHAERIGHGYRTLENEDYYLECVRDDVHFETCPLSSVLTQAVKPDLASHALVRLHQDDSNYSMSSDDPTVTGKYVEHDYKMMAPYLGESSSVKSVFNAAHSCFLPADEKKALLEQLRCAYKDHPEYTKLNAKRN